VPCIQCPPITMRLARMRLVLPRNFLSPEPNLNGCKRQAAIVESSDDPIITKTIEGAVTGWNRGAERVFGYPAQEMLGQSIFRLACVGGENDMIAVLDQIRRGERMDHY